MSTLSLMMAVLAVVAMLGGGAVAVAGKSTIVAILAAGLVSLMASVLFVLLAAPDVAMTEAAIGSGLTTFLFFFVLGRVKEENDD
jgi:uncharacterized MnhB-related membrane protein